MVGFIYKYENRLNHKVYVGQTTDLVNRKSAHKHKATYIKNKFYNAVRKYGWENFDFDVLAQIEENTLDKVCETLDALEIKYIEEYDSFKHGYNSTAGGHSYRGKEVTDEFREYCRNRTYSEETRKKMSEAAKSRKVSKETRAKLSIRAKERDFASCRDKYQKERIEGIRKALGKQVIQISEDGVVVNIFSTLNDAVEYILSNYALNKTKSGISNGIHRHCVGDIRKRLYYGFEWKFGAIV